MASDPPAIAIEPTVSARDNDNTNNEKSQDNTGSSSSQPKLRWKRMLGVKDSADSEADDDSNDPPKEKWTMGIMNDRETEEVPGELFCLYLLEAMTDV